MPKIDVRTIDYYIPSMNARVRTAYLRGSWIEGRHQELVIEAEDGVNIRISRNILADTLQYKASWTHQGKTLPVIDQTDLSQRSLTVRNVAQAFRKVHDEMPLYGLGDCHAFAQRIREVLMEV